MTAALARKARGSGRSRTTVVLLLLVLWFLPLQQGLGQGLSSSEAAAIVREETGGRVLGVKSEKRDGTRVYRVKVLLPKGRVRYYAVDRRTGRIVR